MDWRSTFFSRIDIHYPVDSRSWRQHAGINRVDSLRIASDWNLLVGNGLVRAAELGQFVPGEGWIVEGKGVAPDIVVDNLPFATNKGEDAQLDAAIKVLEEKLAKQPVPKVEVPAYPKMRR